MSFAERVRHFRKLRGITQAELAQAADLTPGAIGDIESGRSKSTPAIDLIARALDVSTNMLREGMDLSSQQYSEGSLSSRERKLLDRYRQLTPSARIKLDGYIDGLPTRSSGKIADGEERAEPYTKPARRRSSG